jgi:hypothetical protein
VLTRDDIDVPLAGWSELPPADRTRRWQNETGDQLFFDFFGIPPDLPPGPDVINALRRIYRDALGGVGGLVEVEPSVIAGVRSVRAIFKLPQEPAGMTYLGVITIPFRDCSFVIKWLCPEQGVTGIRDAAVFAMLSPALDEATGEPQGWAQDPYDAHHKARGLRNRADDAEWDTQFKSHPLSRLRSYLRTLNEVRLTAGALREPRHVGL